MAECLLPKQKVGGSNPLSRSNLLFTAVPSRYCGAARAMPFTFPHLPAAKAPCRLEGV